jgi:hypothetical protein
MNDNDSNSRDSFSELWNDENFKWFIYDLLRDYIKRCFIAEYDKDMPLFDIHIDWPEIDFPLDDSEKIFNI